MQINKIKDRRWNLVVFLLGVVYATVSNLVYTYPNEDSALYLGAAQAIQENGFTVAFDWFSWPFYPALLAYLGELCKVELAFLAKAVNVSLYGIILLLFYNLCRVVTASRAAATWSLIALLSCAKFFEFGSFFVRDIAYWACLLLTLYYACRFVDQHRYAYLSWAIAGTVIAFFFKPESVFYQLPLLSYLLLVASSEGRRNFIIKAVLPAVLAVIVMTFLSERMSDIVYDGFTEKIGDKVTHFIDDFNNRSESLARGLGYYLAEFSTAGLIVTAMIAVLAKLIKLVGVVPVGVLAYALFRKLTVNVEKHKKRLVLLFGVLSLVLPLLNILSVMVIDYRYLMPALFVIVLFFGLIMARLPGGILREGEKPVLISIVVVLLTVNFVERLSDQKDIYPALTTWARDHRLDEDTRFNNNQIGFIMLERAVSLKEIDVAMASLQTCDRVALGLSNWVIYLRKDQQGFLTCLRRSQREGVLKVSYMVSSEQGETVIVTEKIQK